MIAINNRPFASDLITGLMLPDGIFEASLGKMKLNAHFNNSSPSSLSNLNIYAESASHPGILITPITHVVTSIGAGSAVLRSWDVDISAVPAGEYYISFIAENSSGRQRIIKKIFVTRIEFNASNHTFSAQTPQGVYTLRYREITEVNSSKCCRKKGNSESDLHDFKLFENLSYTFSIGLRKIELCPILFLPLEQETGWIPNPQYDGQYSDLPFEDPWWKILIAIIAFLILVAAAIVEGTSGTGSITASIGCPSTPSGVCGSGGGSSPVAAGLVIAAAVVAGIAVYSDERDLLRIGQDKTPPGVGESTIKENLITKIKYLEAIEFGKPFKVGVDWKYERITRDLGGIEKSYLYAESVVNSNVHLLSKYEVSAPDVIRVYKEEPFIVRASFYDEEERLFEGSQLFVKCFLVRNDESKWLDFIMEDNGNKPDKSRNDGVYTGIHYFDRSDEGRWKIYVIAQDVNYANENMTPEEAAQIIGGIVLTNQASVSFSGGTCPLVPDGDVEVIV
jgi:hypothetical protein